MNFPPSNVSFVYQKPVSIHIYCLFASIEQFFIELLPGCIWVSLAGLSLIVVVTVLSVFHFYCYIPVSFVYIYHFDCFLKSSKSLKFYKIFFCSTVVPPISTTVFFLIFFLFLTVPSLYLHFVSLNLLLFG